MPVLGTFGNDSVKAYNFQGPSSDPYWQNVVCYLTGIGGNLLTNNTFLDSSGAGLGSLSKTGVVGQGGVTPFYPNGFGAGFMATTQYVSYPTSVISVAAGATFTIEGWINPYAAPAASTYLRMFGDVNPTTAATIYYLFGIDSNRNPVFVWTDSVGTKTLTGNTAISIGTWSYIQLISNAGALSIAVNGVLQTSTGTATLTTPSSTFGSLGSGAQQGVNVGAQYAGLRVSNVVRPIIKPNNFFTSDANTKLLTFQSPYIKDLSSNNVTITQTGSPYTWCFPIFPTKTFYYNSPNTPGPSAAYYYPNYGGSGNFAGGYLANTTAPGLQIGSNVFCMETMLYPTSVTSTGTIIAKRANSSSFGSFVLLRSGTSLLFYMSTNGSSSWDIANGVNIGTIALQQWYHVAVYRIGNAIYASLNGVITTVYNGTAFTVFADTSAVSVGADNTGTSPFSGYLTSTRYMITAIPSSYTSTACPIPTAPLTSLTGTKLLFLYTNGRIYDAANQNCIDTSVGSAALVTSTFKFAPASISAGYFYLSLNANPCYNFGTGDYTVDMWIQPGSSFAAVKWIFDCYANNTANRWGAYINSGTPTIRVFGASSLGGFSTTGTLTASVWQHLAFSRINGTLYIYINGVLAGSGGFNIQSQLVNSFFLIGADAGTFGATPLTGFLQDFRITAGVGRYTTNFTPPAFPYLAQ